MKKNDIIMLAVIAAGGYVLYNYLKSTGQWDKWFGTGPGTGTNAAPGTGPTAIVDPAYAAYQAAQAQLAAQGQNSVPSVYKQTPVPVNTQVATTPTVTGTVSIASSDPAPAAADPNKVAMLQAAGNADAYAINGLLNADSWSYHYAELFTALTPAQFGQAFPSTAPWRNNLMTAQEFMNQLAGSGLGDIVGPTIRNKSLSFAGPKSAFGGAFRPTTPWKGAWGNGQVN